MIVSFVYGEIKMTNTEFTAGEQQVIDGLNAAGLDKEKAKGFLFHASALSDESGWANGGLYNPTEIVGEARHFRNFNLSYLVPIVEAIKANGDPARVHEVLHCFDVGFGAAELVQHIAKDHKAQEKLGIPPGSLTDDHIHAALLAGIGHDIILSFHLNGINDTTPEALLEARVTSETALKFKGSAQYLKDVIGDDLRGAVAIDRYGTSFPERVRKLAVDSLLNGSDLPTIGEKANLLGKFNPYKVLDAIWYHDGNYPIRGHAEADALVGDRLRLFKEGRVGLDVVAAGVKKLLGYTEQDSQWQERSSKADLAYLTKMVTKKAGAFIEAIHGTPTYFFVVDHLASLHRSIRTLESPAFWAGVDKMPLVMKDLEGTPEVRAALGGQIDTLHQRYEEVQQYRPKGDAK